jgi:glutamate-ammonia-ligase adenylyltransferase
MEIDVIRRYLDQEAEAIPWLRSLGIVDAAKGQRALARIAGGGVTLDLMADLCRQLAEQLPRSSDADMALNNLDRFFQAQRSPLGLATLFERDREALPVLLQIFSTSQHLSDLLVTDGEAYDLLRITEGQPVKREVLIEELWSEIEVLPDERAVMTALRRFKRRETLRIAYGDIVRGQRLDIVTGQISYLADACLEVATRFARRALEAKRGAPRGPNGRRARFTILALGKLGGLELNYSSDIDLICLYDADGATDGQRPLSNTEFFDRLTREVVKLLNEVTDLGQVYRVDLRLRPEGSRGPIASSLEQAIHYYDVLGRTWERQAYVKARPAAGDVDLGHELLRQLEPWIYRRYLGLADIAGIKALKRRIEQRTEQEGGDIHNVKTGHGGIRDIEFVIQFLQLLNGGDLPEIRTGNTLLGIAQLEQCGCLTHLERTILEENYAFLRKIEHRLQIMFDLQTHLLPDNASEMRKLAIRLGYADQPGKPALAAFEADYQSKRELNRRILDHLLHDAFGDDAATEPEVDLVLDPDPPPERIAEVLGRHGFQDVDEAYKNLMALATERIRFLSTRRCRHFLAAIAPRLLAEIGKTPDPDATLINLEKVSDSLGGKGVLWELFSFNAPSLRLYVELCASSPYLSHILISNPGMLDELMDSLVLNKLPNLEILQRMLAELCRAAEDLEPILHSFKNAQVLRVGVRDILGKDDIQATTGALSDVAETCLEQIVVAEYDKLAAKWGEPTWSEGERAGEPCELIILAMGKFGGRELNYNSDLDLIFLYEQDGSTIPGRRARHAQTTTNQHFFSELGQRIIKVAGRLGTQGRLYEVDLRLRPTGRSGALATTVEEFCRYFAEGQGTIWERQALLKSRVIYGANGARQAGEQAIVDSIYVRAWSPDDTRAIRDMRGRLEQTAAAGDIKRGRGGIVDIEFLTQMLQLKYGAGRAALRQAGTLAAIEALRTERRLSGEDAEFFTRAYRFLRRIEARLRLMNPTARDEMPTEPIELLKLARVLGFASGEALLAEVAEHRERVRARFDEIFVAEERPLAAVR